jgi:hypothetical protein
VYHPGNNRDDELDKNDCQPTVPKPVVNRNTGRSTRVEDRNGKSSVVMTSAALDITQDPAQYPRVVSSNMPTSGIHED